MASGMKWLSQLISANVLHIISSALPQCKTCAAIHAHSLEGTLAVCDGDNGSPLYS